MGGSNHYCKHQCNVLASVLYTEVVSGGRVHDRCFTVYAYTLRQILLYNASLVLDPSSLVANARHVLYAYLRCGDIDKHAQHIAIYAACNMAIRSAAIIIIDDDMTPRACLKLAVINHCT